MKQLDSTPLFLTEEGLYCSEAGFHIDPWRPVARAIITHAHSDHITSGCGEYWTAMDGVPLVRMRVDPGATVHPLDWGEPLEQNGIRFSLHAAGHIRGAAQVRLESADGVAVISGDFKREHDSTGAPFEAQQCDTFVTESTFGLPIFRWPNADAVFDSINDWWRSNQAAGQASVIFAYAMGKAQRLLSALNPQIGPIYTHGAIERVCAVYRAAGVELPETVLATNAPRDTDWTRSLILAPPSSMQSPWLRRFGKHTTAMVSGWMHVRGIRRRRSVDRGFVVSDHADFPALLKTIEQTGAQSIFTTHGYATTFAKYLAELGYQACPIATEFVGEQVDTSDRREEQT